MCMHLPFFAYDATPLNVRLYSTAFGGIHAVRDENEPMAYRPDLEAGPSYKDTFYRSNHNLLL